MGARGSLKIASHLSVATEGTAAADVQPVAPDKPDEISADPALSAIWDRVTEGLDHDGLLAKADSTTIELYCRHFVMARKAYDEVMAAGQISLHDAHNQSEKKHPAEAVFRAESSMCLRYGQLLGIAFVTRARTPSAKPTGETDGGQNPFASPAV